MDEILFLIEPKKNAGWLAGALFFKKLKVSFLACGIVNYLDIHNITITYSLTSKCSVPNPPPRERRPDKIALTQLTIKRYAIEGEFGKTILTSREAQCIKELLLGKTMKGIAQTLHISPRTVETHLENIKNKIGCDSKAELIAALLKSNFFKIAL